MNNTKTTTTTSLVSGNYKIFDRFRENQSFQTEMSVKEFSEKSSMYYYHTSNGSKANPHITANSASEGSLFFNNKSAEKNSFKNSIIDCLKSDEFIEGETSKTVMMLESIYLKEPDIFGDVFQLVWLYLFGQENSYELRKLVNMASSIEYEWLNDKADALVLSACGHKDIYVNEAAIRAAESWEQPTHAQYLRNIKLFDVPWLEDYKQSVIEFLE